MDDPNAKTYSISQTDSNPYPSDHGADFPTECRKQFFYKKMANTDSFCIFFVSFQTTYEQWGGSPGLVVKGGGS